MPAVKSWVMPENFPGYVEQEVQFRFDNGVWNPLGGAEPSPRFGHTAVWADGSMIVWGGNSGGGDLNPANPACVAAVQIGGKQPLWDWYGNLISQAAGKHREIIAPKFEAVQRVLAERLGGLGIASWTQPTGGASGGFLGQPIRATATTGATAASRLRPPA